MSRYPWARSFIKQARIFSLFLVLCGLIFIGFQGWNLRNQISEKAYKPNPEIADSLQDLSSTLQDSRDIINNFQKKTSAAIIPMSVETNLDLLPSYDSVASLNLASLQVTNAKEAVASLKQFLVASVQQNLNDLVSQLRAHAATLIPSSSPSNSDTTSPTPTLASPGLRGLFAEEVTSTEAEQRKEQLQQVQDLLNVLLQRTEKPENQGKLQSSISEVKRLGGLLTYLTVPAELTTTTTDLQSNTDPNATPAPEVTAAKMADLIEASENIVQEAITSKWLVEEKIAIVEPIILQEQKEAAQAVDDINALYIAFFESVFIILLVSGIVAYTVQIAADILQAHIDNADNSFLQRTIPETTL